VDRPVGGVYQERISRSLTLCDCIFYGLGKVALAHAWRPLAIKDRSRQSKMQLGFCCRSIGGDCDDSWIVGKQEVRAEQRVVQEGSSPSGAQMRGAISKKRCSQPRWPEKVEGMETSKRARRRKLDTAKTDLKPPLVVLRRAGCPP
jgi:hypothetical protein